MTANRRTTTDTKPVAAGTASKTMPTPDRRADRAVDRDWPGWPRAGDEPVASRGRRGDSRLSGLAMWVGAAVARARARATAARQPPCRPTPIVPRPGTVERWQPGRPGYRMRLPEQGPSDFGRNQGGHCSAASSCRLPASLYGLLSGHGLWYPVNLLAGMVLAGRRPDEREQLDNSSCSLLLVAW